MAKVCLEMDLDERVEACEVPDTVLHGTFLHLLVDLMADVDILLPQRLEGDSESRAAVSPVSG